MDQVFRGPGRAAKGFDIRRLDKPCPPDLAEWLMCKDAGFVFVPGDLRPGTRLDEQPADTVIRYTQLVACYRAKLEYYEAVQARKQQSRRGRRR